MNSPRTVHETCLLARAVVFSAILGLQGVTAEEERPDVPFANGDIVVRTQKCLSLFRDRTQVTTFGAAWHIGADDRGRLWAGAVDEDKIRLRCYTSTAEYEEYVTSPEADGIQLHKVLYWDNSVYVLYSVSWEGVADGPWTVQTETAGRIRGRWVHVVSLNPSTGSFGRPIPLSDFFGRPEIVLPSRKLVDGRPLPKGVRDTVLDLGLWDATITPSGKLWLSTQAKITSYRLGGLPAGLAKLLGPVETEGLGQRTQKIDWWISRHGNGTGIVALSDTEIAVVNGNPPGGITIVNTLDPPSSVQLTQSVFPDAPPKWGLRPVIDVGDAILVAHAHADVAAIYRVSKVTGAVSTFASNIVASEMVQIRK
ncbi:MAG: hypothetical protein H8E44_24955 [Planctomycetes bacterium]|nr:hypothetical protein [Planctomycetota bacterium]MBL7038777.1 hypothetical protein [Pirellulaceae bacterium]